MADYLQTLLLPRNRCHGSTGAAAGIELRAAMVNRFIAQSALNPGRTERRLLRRQINPSSVIFLRTTCCHVVEATCSCCCCYCCCRVYTHMLHADVQCNRYVILAAISWRRDELPRFARALSQITFTLWPTNS